MSGRRLVVVGGGLAGINAALKAADAGCEVTLLERRRRLGGLTWSFERNGRWFDNGCHVFMRCCAEYRAFIDRLGMSGSVTLQPRLDVPVLSPGGARASLRRSGLPTPFHLAGTVARYHHLSPVARMRVMGAVAALRKLDPDDPDLDAVVFGDWLTRHGQSADAISDLWDLITLPTLNIPASRASTALAAKVFRTGLLDTADGGDLGWSTVPLRELHGESGERALVAAGVEVVVEAAAEGIAAQGGGFVVSTPGRQFAADSVVVASPPPVTARLLPRAAGLGDLGRLGSSPIVNVQMVFDRQVTDLAVSAAVRSPVQFVFDRTASSGSDRGQCLVVSLSAADASIGRRGEDLVHTFSEALGDLFPDVRRARLVDAVVTRERSATFAAVAGSRAWRPKESTAIPGLFVAGAWCDTGWPATMEGAVRSGGTAAREAIEWLQASASGGSAMAPPTGSTGSTGSATACATASVRPARASEEVMQ